MALYVRLLVRATVRRGWSTRLLTTKRAVQHPAFQLVQREASTAIDVSLMREVDPTSSGQLLPLLLDQDRYFRSVAEGVRNLGAEEQPDHIYVVNLDHFDKILAVRGTPFGAIPFSGMMMNLKYHRNRMGIGLPSRSDWLYEKLFLRVLRIHTLRNTMVIDEPFYEYSRRSAYKKEYRKLRYVNDVGELNGSETREMVREALKIPNDRFVILVYGMLTVKKGIESLLNAVDTCDRLKVTVLLAGTQDERIKSLLAEPLARSLLARGQLVESAEFHDSKREYRVFKAADVVWIGYVGRSFGSSGVLFQAGSMRLPVLATSEGLIGWLVRRHRLGLTITPEDKKAVADAIERLYSDKELFRNLSDNGQRLSHQHTGRNFGNTICDAIEANLATIQ